MKGLYNLGNSCYFNCAVQCFLQVPQLSNFLILREYKGSCKFTQEYQVLVRKFWLRKGDYEVPEQLLKLFKEYYPQFDNLDQQDSQEAFLCLIDIIDKSLSDLSKRTFYGKVIQETVCPTGTTKQIEPSAVTILSGSCLKSALIEHQKWTVLENFRDSNDKVHHVATTRTLFWETPSILIFSFNMYNGKHKVDIPDTFDLTDWMHKDCPSNQIKKYNLFGTCTHHGHINFGHYVAYVKHKGQWYLKNDDKCSKVNFPNNEFHYLVLYKRVNSSI